MTNDWDYYPELEKIPPGMPEPPVTPQGNAGADGAAQAKPDCDNWQDDPSADERWNAGLDFGMVQLCAVLGVDPHMATWDAATETLDGDVCAAIGNIFRTKYGDDFDPTASSVPSAQCNCHPYIADTYGHDKSCPMSSHHRTTEGEQS